MATGAGASAFVVVGGRTVWRVCSIALVSDWYTPRLVRASSANEAGARRGHCGDGGNDAHVITIDRGPADADDGQVQQARLRSSSTITWPVPGPRLIHTLYNHFQSTATVDVVPRARHVLVAGARGNRVHRSTRHTVSDDAPLASYRPAPTRGRALVYAGLGHRTNIITAVSMAAAADARQMGGRNERGRAGERGARTEWLAPERRPGWASIFRKSEC